jgi:hypothetical protein
MSRAIRSGIEQGEVMVAIWRAAQWLGCPRGELAAAMLAAPRRLSVLALRSDPLRVVAGGSVELAPGDVRGTQIRLVGVVAGALSGLRVAMNLPTGTGLIGLLDATADRQRTAGIDAEPAALISRRERISFERTAQEAGFLPVGVAPIPAARLRAGANPDLLTGRHHLPPDHDLLAAAALSACGGLGFAVDETDDVASSPSWHVESIGGPSWS